MAVFNRQIAQAKRMIKAKGELVTWVKHTAISSNPAQPWNTSDPGGPAPTPITAYIVFTNQKGLADSLFHLMQGTSVPMGGPSGLMAQVPFVPEINDTVIRASGVKLVVKDFNVVSPNGEVILYKLAFA